MKHNYINKGIIIALLLSILLSVTGCDEVQIFKKKVRDDILVPLTDKEIENDKFYIKEGSKFYETYIPNGGNTSNEAQDLDERRAACVCKMETKIPSLYQNELIAYASDKKILNDITLERYKNLGYSIGCSEGKLTDDGYLQYDRRKNIIEKSSLNNVLKNANSDIIRIASINGQTLSQENIDVSTGTIIGLEKYKDYKIGYYAGTKYCEDIVNADTMILKAYELYVYDKSDIQDTPNGYVCYALDEDMENGFYRVNDGGVFKYYNHLRGENDDVDMNVSHYSDEMSKIAAYSRQYTVTVPQRVKDMKINATYVNVAEQFSEESIKGYVFAPDKTQYEMTKKDGVLSLNLSEASPGEWTVNIIPKSLEISDMNVESSKAEETPTLYEKEFEFPEGGSENIVFQTRYTKKAEENQIYGVILSPDGRSYELELWDEKDETSSDYNKKIYYIGYSLPYAQEGKYIMRIYYHPEEITFEEPYISNFKAKDSETIIIDG